MAAINFTLNVSTDCIPSTNVIAFTNISDTIYYLQMIQVMFTSHGLMINSNVLVLLMI